MLIPHILYIFFAKFCGTKSCWHVKCAIQFLMLLNGLYNISFFCCTSNNFHLSSFSPYLLQPSSDSLGSFTRSHFLFREIINISDVIDPSSLFSVSHLIFFSFSSFFCCCCFFIASFSVCEFTSSLSHVLGNLHVIFMRWLVGLVQCPVAAWLSVPTWSSIRDLPAK